MNAQRYGRTMLVMLAVAVLGTSFATALASGGASVSQQARSRVFFVAPGESIQAAINRADPGDTVIVGRGVFRENVEISEDDITLLGSGSGLDGTVLRPPRQPRLGECSFGDPNFAPGICVLGRFNQQFELVDPASGVQVSGFRVERFGFSGILGLGTQRLLVTYNHAWNNEEYGITSFVSTEGRYIANTAEENGDAGFYIGDAPDADFVASANISRNNFLGFLIRDANNGKITYNQNERNCLGIFLLNTYAGADNWNVGHNIAFQNNRVCAFHEEAEQGAEARISGGRLGPRGGVGIQQELVFSGGGIALAGARSNTVHHNIVRGNRPQEESPFAGGIVLVSTWRPSAFNLVKENLLRWNRPADIVWDGRGRGNEFVRNDCQRSIPPGLCN